MRGGRRLCIVRHGERVGICLGRGEVYGYRPCLALRPEIYSRGHYGSGGKALCLTEGLDCAEVSAVGCCDVDVEGLALEGCGCGPQREGRVGGYLARLLDRKLYGV